MTSSHSIRPATELDVPALEILIPLSIRALQAPYYSAAQMDAALGPVFGVDRQLMIDGTYYVVENPGGLIACGGWSRRHSLFGSDQARNKPDPYLDPNSDPARIRAFFVHPSWARKGLGRLILLECEQAIQAAGFHKAVLIATLAGEPLYASFDYKVAERYEVPLPNDLTLPVVRMTKNFPAIP